MPRLNFDEKDMIAGECAETHTNSAIVEESSQSTINSEEKTTVLGEADNDTQAEANKSRLKTKGDVLEENGIGIHSNIAPVLAEQICINIVETGNTGTTALDRKNVVYAIPVSESSNTILSLTQSDAVTPNHGPIVPTISENNVNFEPQISTSENNLLGGFINPTEKDELVAGSMESTDLGRGTQEDDSSALDNSTHIDHDAGIPASDEQLSQELGDLPPWAARLKGCERIGDSYRGYVHDEAELDILLSMHKEHTHSSWGTRQSPSSQKPSVRFMWKSQYVPYDGIPFLNSGRRATVMECQYGPRRKGNKVKVEYNENGQAVKPAHRPTCPARIYVKRVRKFPEFKVDESYEGTPGLRLAQERALTSLRVACPESQGEERFYVQFPLEIAHEYHHDDDEMFPHQTLTLLPTQANLGSSRLDSRVVEKINELVARGVTDIYQVKHGVINFVEKDLFLCVDEPIPARQNKLFFPTITDLQNHIHQAILALESGTLESLPPPENLPKTPSKDDRIRKRKRAEPRRVRASKTTPFKTICIRTDDSMELARDPSLQDGQGQVYVMVPSASSLFPNSESLSSTSLDGGDKATSLVQVLTVPASSSSALLAQQGEGALDITEQFLALPVVSCNTTEGTAMVVQDSPGKEPISAIPVSMMNIRSSDATSSHTIEDHIQTGNILIPSGSIAMATTISPPSVTMATPISPSSVTIATPVTSEILMTSPSLAEQVTSSSAITMTSSSSVAPVAPLDITMNMTPPPISSSRDFPLSYDPIISSTILMSSPDKIIFSKTLVQTTTTSVNIQPSSKTISDTNRFYGGVKGDVNPS